MARKKLTKDSGVICLHCRKNTNQHKAKWGKVCQGCLTEYVEGVEGGTIEPPHRRDCPQCEAKNVPAMFASSRYCDPVLTGRHCKDDAKRAANTRYRNRDVQDSRGKQHRLPKASALDPAFNRATVCHRPSTCKNYSGGYGCEKGRVPCSDRWEHGQLWEYDANGGKPCWEKGEYPKIGGYGLGALGHTNSVYNRNGTACEIGGGSVQRG